MNPRPSHRRHAAFTLVELLVASALMSIVLIAAYASLHAGLEARRIVEPRGDAFQTARVALALLSADLRAACPLHKGPEFLGMRRQIGKMEADNLDFATHNYTPVKSGQGDYCCVSWFVERDPATGETRLWRRRNPVLGFDPLSGGSREEIASGVRGLTIEYYDGFDWYDTWGDKDGEAKQANSFRDRPNLTGMPTAVRVTLLLDAEPAPRGRPNPDTEAKDAAPPLSFQTLVKLNLAGLPSASGSGPSSSSPGSGTPAGNPGGPRQP
jgi:prepilin-type N-terminal cleavage/methylation domain-containing protein